MIKAAMSVRSKTADQLQRRSGSRVGMEQRHAASAGAVKRAKTPGSRSGASTKASKTRSGKSGSSRQSLSSLAKNEIVEQEMEGGLKQINMSKQGMTTVPHTLFSRKDVGALDLSSNNLRSIPSDIQRLRHLVKLDLSRNGIRCMHANDYTGMPAEMAVMVGLEVLYIAECNLAFVPPVVWRLYNLKELDISRNKINILVPEVGNLSKLQHLDAQQTNIGSLPAEIAFCQDLQELILWGNTIETLPDTLKELPHLYKLALNYRSFSTMVDGYMENLLRKGQIESEHIPPVIFEMPSLRVLDLEETKINALPDTCLAKLEEFTISRNFFSKIPAMTFQLTAMHWLDISDNQITQLPPDIGQLVSLSVFRANNNLLESIPTTFSKLVKLVEVNLTDNKLQAIPFNIGKLTNLTMLYMANNQIEVIPESVIDLKVLHTLDLSNNLIQSLPVHFYEMASLKTAHTYNKYYKHGLWLHLNPLNTPPPEVWKTEDPEQIYNYLKNLQIRQTENLQRLKLVLLGEAQCGKTSIIRTMVARKAAPTTDYNDSTRLLDYSIWKTQNQVEFMVLDLGGDPSYKNLLPMFLDAKAMYIVVYDHRSYKTKTHQQQIGQWLELVQLYAPGALVKIIGTQCDQIVDTLCESNLQLLKQELDAQKVAMQERIEKSLTELASRLQQDDVTSQIYIFLMKQKKRLEIMLQNPVKVDPEINLVSSSAEGIKDVLRLINKLEVLAVDKELYPHAQRYIPDYWHKFRIALKLQKEHYLSMKEVLALGAKDYQMKPDVVQQCLSYLNDIGEILWFTKIPALTNVVFHRPHTLVDLLRCIFKHDIGEFLNFGKNRVFAHRGQFKEDTFSVAKGQFEKCGEVSRPMLKCLWFYKRLGIEDDEFKSLLQYLQKLDIAFSMPQRFLPPRRTEFVPLVVIPANNRRPRPDDLSAQWSAEPDAEETEASVEVTFPLNYPEGLFEQMACRIQDYVHNRQDWMDLVLADIADTSILISRQLSTQTYNLEFKVTARSKTEDGVQRAMSLLSKDLYNIISLCPGLVWFMALNTIYQPKINIEDWFPKALFSRTQ